MKKAQTRAEGFSGQLIHVLPDAALALQKKDPLLKGLHPTRAGYFPNASGHVMSRKQGIEEAILIFCLSGSGWCMGTHGKRIAVPTGSALLIPPGAGHIYGADANAPWTISWVHFCGGELEPCISLFASSMERRRQIAILRSCLEAQSAIERLLRDFATGFVFSNLLAAASELRTALARLHLKSRSLSKQSTNADLRIEETVHWMSGQLRESLSLSEMARKAGCSIPHFIALFRARMGTSPGNYFLRLRIQRSCHLLDTTSLPVKTIADQTGFSDPYYFSRCFRNVMGRSPLAYRKMDKI